MSCLFLCKYWKNNNKNRTKTKTKTRPLQPSARRPPSIYSVRLNIHLLHKHISSSPGYTLPNRSKEPPTPRIQTATHNPYKKTLNKIYIIHTHTHSTHSPTYIHTYIHIYTTYLYVYMPRTHTYSYIDIHAHIHNMYGRKPTHTYPCGRACYVQIHRYTDTYGCVHSHV